MPAAAVIPAPVAYIKVAAVKKLVVGFLVPEGVVCGLSAVYELCFHSLLWGNRISKVFLPPAILFSFLY